MAAKITVKDIAKKCSVSPGTVSRVLNNRSNVKEETRKKILETIRQLKYDPFKNLPLVNNVKTRALGLVVPTINYDANHPFSQRAILAFQGAASGREYTTMLLSEGDIIRKTTEQYHLGSRNIPCDALTFFCPTQNWDQYLAVLKDWGIPCVLIRRKTKVCGIPTINDNDVRGGTMLLEHLYEQGHRTIGYYTRNVKTGKAIGRTKAYFAFHEKHGLPVQDPIIYDAAVVGKEGFADWFNQAMSCKPTAFFCGDDAMAVDLLNHMHGLGIRVPDDVSVGGYDNDYIATLSTPPLTTVNIPVEQMCRMAVNVTDELLQGTRAGKMDIELENELVIRKSVKNVT